MTVRRLNRLGALLGVAILVAAGLFVSAARAADGALDTTGFGIGGIVTTDVGAGGNDFANSAALQSDGKLVVAGVNGGRDFALARYNADGSLDTTFDGDTGTGNGVVITNLGGTDDIGISVAIQADGKIVVAGVSNKNGGYDFALVRYNTNGTLDATFDGDGIAITDLGGFDKGMSVAIQADGKLVVAGYSDANGGNDFALVRYNTNGTFDGDIGTGNGVVITNLGGTDDIGISVAIQADGKIVVAGYSNANGGYDFALVRYNTNGTLDATFDGDGIAITDLGGTNDFGVSVAIQADGKIVVAGYSNANGGYDFALVRYNTNGTFDGDIGTGNGVVITNLGGTNDFGSSVATQADGKIVVAGVSNKNGGYDFALVRYNTNGTLDTTFDSDGIAITNLGGTDDEGVSVAIQTDGKIVVAGYNDANGTYDFAVVRYLATSLTATLASGSPTSNSASITFTVTGTGTIDCTTLSATPGVDFDLTGITAITAITQTSPTVCTIAATSSAIAGGGAVTSTLTSASSFSIGYTYGNTRTLITNSPQSITVTIADSTPTTTTPPTTTPVAPETTYVKPDSLPATGRDSSSLALLGLLSVVGGLVLAIRRKIIQ